MRRFLKAGTAAMVVVAGSAGVALSQGLDRPSPTPTDAGPVALQPASAVDERLSDAFALLRRPAKAEDALPEHTAAILNEVNGTVGGGNALLSRRSMATPGGQLYAVPGAGQLCLVTARGDAGTGTSCVEAESATQFGLASSQAARPGSTDRLVQGLVPDGVTVVRLRTSDGKSIQSDVIDNGFQVVAPANAIEIELVGTGRSVPLVVPPAG